MSADPLPVDEIARLAAQVRDRVATVVVGMGEAVELALASILAGGHVLFEDVPGLGKTLAARSLGTALGLDGRQTRTGGNAVRVSNLCFWPGVSKA